ncbi:glycosyltransferase family 4 protein [Thermococcus paralvinellae]|uniref:Glycosyl transferase family protein 10 n=1 Tax=Thermococcus paralvinellae TaxID=582419 RepID=W0I568_9EURY|nr:glycosyltransferase family 4 protein [Thermococcus paralvinellae]AHF81261.1 glycosyl transferase family protein 10 [Thermococcus paralvinellae]
MKIVMIVSNPFKPDPRVYKEAKSLVKHGHKVTVIAWDREGEYPKEESIDGIRVLRIKVKSKYGNFFDFLLKLPFFYLKSLKLLLKEDFDVIHTHDFDTAILGLLIRRLKDIRWIYDVHDLYESLVEKENSRAAKVISKLERIIIDLPDYVIVVNDAFIRLMRERGRTKPILVIMNTIEPIKVEKQKSKRFTLFYAGVLSSGRFILEMIDIAKELRIRLKIAGSGKLEHEVKKRCHDSCLFLGYIPHRKALEELSKSHATFAIYTPKILNNLLAAPNKLFEAMCLKVPIIAVKGSVMSKIVERHRCGVTVEYEKKDVKEKVRHIMENPKLIKKMGHNGRKGFLKEYTWRNMEEKLVKLYEGLK